jgi:hypothetical protein
MAYQTKLLVKGRGGAIDVSQERELRVELDDEGRDSGVELEEQDGQIHEPFDPAEIDVQTRTPTVDLLMSRLRRGVLDLEADFQRATGIWSDVNQSRLIESLLLRIPLPTLYAAESGEETWTIVDGIQRLSTIARFVDPDVISARPLKLRGLEYLYQYEGRQYYELPPALQTRINETELIVHLIRSGTPEPVKFNIFARINTGGRPLTPQELRHALIPGRARLFLKELADSEAFLDATQRSVSPTRMADREMVLRFLAFRIFPPGEYRRGDLDAFLRQAMRHIDGLSRLDIEHLTVEFIKAMQSAASIFGPNAFRKQFPGQERLLPVNKALFEAISVNLAGMTSKETNVLYDRRDRVQESFLELMESGSFLQAISGGTGDVVKVRTRFAAIDEMFGKVLA